MAVAGIDRRAAANGAARPSTFGFPLAHLESNERRGFLPCLLQFLDRAGAQSIVLEEGYGEGMGVSDRQYLDSSTKLKFGSYEDCLAQDAVVVVRCPTEEALHRLEPGTVLVSMLHFPTRPGRVALLAELGLRAVSLDSVTDDQGRRLVENMQAVGWNGVHAAFAQLAVLHRRFSSPARGPIRVCVLGAGAVAGHAVRAATRYGDDRLHEQMAGHNVLGVEVTVVDFDVTWNENYMLGRLEQTDVLVDATRRRDTSRFVIPNEWLEALPQKSVILDLAADPYDLSQTPPRVKGIEGIPDGNLDRYVFPPDDPAYDRIDRRIDTTNRRVAVSCYAWPGVEPLACMQVYSAQVEPVLGLLIDKPMAEWEATEGGYFERAAARAELSRWRAAHAR
jgi:alanine dehydrogenase